MRSRCGPGRRVVLAIADDLGRAELGDPAGQPGLALEQPAKVRIGRVLRPDDLDRGLPALG